MCILYINLRSYYELLLTDSLTDNETVVVIINVK